MKIISFFILIISSYYCFPFNVNPLLRNDINAYHFHTYFFQENSKSIREATTFRNSIATKIKQDYFHNCIVSDIYDSPHGPHPIANFITCCNATSMWKSIPWFMQNHGNLSVLLHALSRNWLSDHTDRAMWLGREVPLDFTRYTLPNDYTVLRCVPEDWP